MFCPTLECPSDTSLFWFYIACAGFMSVGFASIVTLAGELVNRQTFEKKDDKEDQ